MRDSEELEELTEWIKDGAEKQVEAKKESA
jgi:hypothetical protein